MTHIHIIGDQEKRKYDEDLVSQVNAEIETEERRKRLEDKRKAKEEPKLGQPKSEEIDKSKFVLVESENRPLLYAMERSRFGLNFEDTQQNLHDHNAFMPTPLDFVNYLAELQKGLNGVKEVYDGNGKQLQKEEIKGLLKTIMEKTEGITGEWLDAKFGTGPHGSMFITYHVFRKDSRLAIIDSLILDTLLEDKEIDYVFWLNEHTRQGLPRKGNPRNDTLFYTFPTDNAVATFLTSGKDSPNLNCNFNKDYKSHDFGVREVRIVR